MKSIALKNYRCFENLSLSFGDGVNLLIGDNASGKTTIIRGISSVLNSFFVGFSDENTRFTGLSKDDFRIVETETGLANENPIEIDFELLGVEASLHLNSVKGRTLQKPLEPIQSLGQNLYKGLFENGKQLFALPLFANFSTSDIHSTRKLSREKFKKYEHKPSFGYYECLQGDGFLDYWTTRLLILREANKGEVEIKGVLDALVNSLGAKGCNILNGIDIRPIRGKVFYYLTDGRVTDTENLSDGYRRLVNIVLDIAFRCMLINQGIYGIDACLKTEGTVLIDEIDLHLHPSLQASVIKGLQAAFPKLQFIITSYAPMLMTNIERSTENRIYKLTYALEEGYSAKKIETYGLDISTLVEVVLGLVPRPKEVDKRLEELFNFIDNEEYKKAAARLEVMRSEFGEQLPELAKAEAMLNFLTNGHD